MFQFLFWISPQFDSVASGCKIILNGRRSYIHLLVFCSYALTFNALASDLHLYGLDQGMSDPVYPAEGGVVGHGHIGQHHTEVGAVDQITVTGNGARHLLAEVSLRQRA